MRAQSVGSLDVKATCAARLKAARKARQLTLEQVGYHLSITKQRMSQFESGNNLPGLLSLLSLADLYGVSLDYLVGRVDAPEGIVDGPKDTIPPAVVITADEVCSTQINVAARKLTCASNDVQRAIDAMELIKETLAKVAELTPGLLSQVDLT